MSQLVLTAVGADRPGIVARVTGELARAAANLEDTSMTILGGQFAMVLVVDADQPAEALEQAVAAATEDLGLTVTVRPAGPDGSAARHATHLLSAYGSDRPGLVAGVSRALADADVNVTDLTTRVLSGERTVYAMLFEVAVPPAVDDEDLLAAVRAAVDEVDVTLRPLDTATL